MTGDDDDEDEDGTDGGTMSGSFSCQSFGVRGLICRSSDYAVAPAAQDPHQLLLSLPVIDDLVR